MAALVRLLSPLGVAQPAVRTAVSRMVRQGWLEPVRLPGGPGYALTPRAVRRLDDAAARIYRTGRDTWDGTWHLLVTTEGPERSRRERLRGALAFLGYAQLDDGTTWIGPRASDEVDALLETEGVEVERFTARHDGDTMRLVRRAWRLEDLATAYTAWLHAAQALVAGSAGETTDEQAFATRSRLVHEWRKFLFRDPGLPRALLPEPWPGDEAAAFFDSHSTRLLPAAARYVDACLSPVTPEEDARG